MRLKGNAHSGPTVGIDIGSDQIKVAEARPGKDVINITALGVASTPPGTIENDIIINPAALGQALKDLLKNSKVTTNKSVSSVAGQSSVVVRIIELPKMTFEELEKTMPWEVERHVPFSANEVVMDFAPIERPLPVVDEQNMEVLLAVAQQDVIKNHVEVLLAAGLDPVAIEVEQVAICRSLLERETEPGANASIVVMDIGANGTEIGIYQHGLLAFPRTVPIGGNAITRALSDAFGISIEEAEELKLKRAVVIPERASFFSGAAMMPGLGGFQGEETTAGFDLGTETGSEMDIGFIPGLGFSDTPVQTPEEEAKAPDYGVSEESGTEYNPPSLDFDFDLGIDVSQPTGESGLAAEETSIAGVPEAGPLQAEEITETQIFDAMAPVIMDLVSEVRRSLDYYSGRFQSMPDSIYLCGGTAKMRGLTQLIQNELGIPVTIPKLTSKIQVSPSALPEGGLDEVATIFPVSLGLAVRDLIGE